MGAFNAGVWFTLMVVYFIFFGLIISGTYGIANEYNVTNQIETYDYGLITGREFCDSPRYKYDAATGSAEPYPGKLEDRLACDESRGVLSQTECERLIGCTWEPVSNSTWWESIFGSATTYYTCTGHINASNYSVDYKYNIVQGWVIEPHNNTGWWNANAFGVLGKVSVCNHPNVVHNESACAIFSCTWSEDKLTADIKNPSAFVVITGDLFSPEYNTFVSNNSINTILYMLFIVLPLLMLLISLYFMLPFLHGG